MNKLTLLVVMFCNVAIANGFDVVTMNLPEEGRRYELAGCETQFDGKILSAICQQGIPVMPAEVYRISGTPIQFDTITDNGFWWFTEIPNPEWGACRLILVIPYDSYTAYTVQCVRGQIFADGFTE